MGEDGALPKMLPREGAPRDAQQRGREGGATAPGAGPCPLSRTGTPSIGLGHTGAVEAEMSSPIITCLCGQAGRMVAGREHDWEVRGVSMGSRADCGQAFPAAGSTLPRKFSGSGSSLLQFQVPRQGSGDATGPVDEPATPGHVCFIVCIQTYHAYSDRTLFFSVIKFCKAAQTLGQVTGCTQIRRRLL